MLKTNKKPQLWFSCYEKAFVLTLDCPGTSQEYFLRRQLPVALQKLLVQEGFPLWESWCFWVLVPLNFAFFLQVFLLGLYPVFGTLDPLLQASVMIQLAFWVSLDLLLPSGARVPLPSAFLLALRGQYTAFFTQILQERTIPPLCLPMYISNPKDDSTSYIFFPLFEICNDSVEFMANINHGSFAH